MQCEGSTHTVRSAMLRHLYHYGNIFAKDPLALWQWFGKHGISMSCHFTWRFLRDIHKSNFRATGKLSRLSESTFWAIEVFGMGIIIGIGKCISASVVQKLRPTRTTHKNTWFKSTLKPMACKLPPQITQIEMKTGRLIWFSNNKIHLQNAESALQISPLSKRNTHTYTHSCSPHHAMNKCYNVRTLFRVCMQKPISWK